MPDDKLPEGILFQYPGDSFSRLFCGCVSNYVFFIIVRDDGTTRSTHKKPKEDTFGQNDDDWMVYRSIVSST